MGSPEIIERTLYTPLVNYLEEIGADSIPEAGIGRGASDIFFTFNNERFVVEVKIGEHSTSFALDAFAQAAEYAEKYQAKNWMTIVYPKSIKMPVTSETILKDVALNQKTNCIIYSKFWTESFESTPKEIFDILFSKISLHKHDIDLETVVGQIKKIVSDFATINSQFKKGPIISEVVQKLDLFTSLGGVLNKKLAENQLSVLASYLLFNQILFYRIFRQLTDGFNLPELNAVRNVQGLEKYFEKITEIDFKSIYKVNILKHIPNSPVVIEMLNKVISSIKLLNVEYITHDLAGRFFHDLIPFEIRKILAAFYTNPKSADLLAGLAINSWDEKIFDPACGSGTLLVAGYQKKMSLYKERFGYSKISEAHTRFLKEQITGIDIMPFAAHLTAVNLAMQEIDKKADFLRIASADSLQYAGQLRTKKFSSGTGIKISGLATTIQTTLSGKNIIQRKGGALSLDGSSLGFNLEPVDLVIMNPPFSDREKLPKEIRDKINANKILNQICGNQINLWGLFISLSHFLIKPNGRIAAVIPFNIARGRASEKIRKFLLENYSIRFIIKPIKGDYFSEGSAFDDVLFIADKKIPLKTDHVAIIALKIPMAKWRSKQYVDRFIHIINTCYKDKDDVDTPEISIRHVNLTELKANSKNLMPLLAFKTEKSRIIISEFLQEVKNCSGSKLRKLVKAEIEEGFHASPKGLSELVFITNPIDKSRIKRAFLILKETNPNSIIFQIKNLKGVFKVPKNFVQPALRTLTSVKKIDVDKVDFILTKKPQGFEKILLVSKWKGKFDWFTHANNAKSKESHIVVARRFNPHSPNTHLFAFFSNKKIVSPHTFKILKFTSSSEALVQSLILNSSFTIANMMSHREQTTGALTDIMESDLILFDVFNFRNLSSQQVSNLHKLFKKLSKIEFPSLVEQFQSSFEGRKMLDYFLLELLGFDKNKIELVLKKLYNALYDELDNTKKEI